MKSTQINMRCSPEHKADIEKQANSEGRTVSNYMLNLHARQMQTVMDGVLKPNKITRETPDVSHCCSAPGGEETETCSACGEHCLFIHQ